MYYTNNFLDRIKQHNRYAISKSHEQRYFRVISQNRISFFVCYMLWARCICTYHIRTMYLPDIVNRFWVSIECFKRTHPIVICIFQIIPNIPAHIKRIPRNGTHPALTGKKCMFYRALKLCIERIIYYFAGLIKSHLIDMQ